VFKDKHHDAFIVRIVKNKEGATRTARLICAPPYNR
jgi:hypothetical protein